MHRGLARRVAATDDKDFAVPKSCCFCHCRAIVDAGAREVRHTLGLQLTVVDPGSDDDGMCIDLFAVIKHDFFVTVLLAYFPDGTREQYFGPQACGLCDSPAGK